MWCSGVNAPFLPECLAESLGHICIFVVRSGLERHVRLLVVGTCEKQVDGPYEPHRPSQFGNLLPKFSATVHGGRFSSHRQSVGFTFVMMNSITSPRAVGSELIARLAGTL